MEIKISKWNLIKHKYPFCLFVWTQNLLHSKGKHKQNEKTAHKMEENIYKWCDQQGISLQNLQLVQLYIIRITTQLKNKQKT